MAWNVIAWARRIPYIRPIEKFVLVTLADASNKEGACYPGQRTMADDCNLSDRHLRRLIRNLEGYGLITSFQRLRENGSYSSLNYQLQITIEPAMWRPPGSSRAGENATPRQDLQKAFRELLHKRMADNGQEEQFLTWLPSLRIVAIEKTRIMVKLANDTILEHVKASYSSLLLQIVQEAVSPHIRKIRFMSQKSGS